MSRVDYSKWDHIEISDDEDDVHPNIDTPSLFRWRHQARVERMESAEQEKSQFDKAYTDHQRKLLEIKQQLRATDKESACGEFAKLKIEELELEEQEQRFKKKEDELRKKERLTPLNIDTICKDGKSKTVINKYKEAKVELTEDEKFEKQAKHTRENEKLIKKFGMLQRYEDSQNFLVEHSALVCEETANFLVIWCINLEVEEKHDLMHHVAHQTIVMQFILELAKQLEIDPRGCVKAFFSRISLAEKQYMLAFDDELNSFKDRVRGRAQVRLEAAMKEVEEEEKKTRLGPGGLDPADVFESLPKEMQECFESKNIEMLQEVLSNMPNEEAQQHMKACISSGLWVPGGNESDEADMAEPIHEETPDKAESKDESSKDESSKDETKGTTEGK